ncbi:MAG: ATP-binding cassette domain-containing protein [Neptuniibacter sp.]
MARAPLLQLSGVTLGYGGNPLFSNLDLAIHPGDRLALVGRNGSGKSTLLKVMAGLVEADAGEVIVPPGRSVGYMDQDPDMAGCVTLGDFAARGLEPGEMYRVERAAEGLKFAPETPVATASGGERRRAALAGLMARAPDLMLLDEPTNHLDIEAITWLEEELKATRAAFVLISHDRRFLRELSRATLWLDRGVVRRQDKGFEAFEAWRDTTWAEEDEARHKLNRKIKAEARWAVEGISARRKRNQGRMRALQSLRAERAEQIRRQGAAGLALDGGPRSGKKVIIAEGLSKSYDDRAIVRDLSLTLERGDRVAFVGPNGVGKTTLLKLLLGQETPDKGSVRHGTNLEIAVFDQARAQLDPDQSLWDALTGEPDMRVSGQSDQVMVRGTPRHVVGYLKEFLFDESQARAPVRALSGGEKARLLLARLMARQSNVLVLDEPTNDLDIETLELLEEIILNFDGTILLVSHDRTFLDSVVTSTLVFESPGELKEYVGGYQDWLRQRSSQNVSVKKASQKSEPEQSKEGVQATGGAKPKKLSYKLQRELEMLPAQMEEMESSIEALQGETSAPDFYQQDHETVAAKLADLGELEQQLEALMERWVELEAMQEA